MDESDKPQILGRNPLSFLTDGEVRPEKKSVEILKEKMINNKLGKKCVHLSYSNSYEQYHCANRRSRQRGFLGEKWREKCKSCHVKEVK